MFQHRTQPLKFCQKIYSCHSRPPLSCSPFQTCTMAEKHSRWSSPRPLHVPTAAGWATQRCPCRSMWLQSTRRPPQKWYVVALSFTQQRIWNFVCTAINNRTRLDLCCVTSEEVIFFFPWACLTLLHFIPCFAAHCHGRSLCRQLNCKCWKVTVQLYL